MGEEEATAVRFGERELTEAAAYPVKTAAGLRHGEAYELNYMNKDGTRMGIVEQEVDIFGSVPRDQKDMHRMGKEQEMKRVFRQFSLLSFTAVLMATWEFLLMANTQGLICGGRAGLFWSFLWSMAGFGFLTASLAEMASMAPTAGGQYHWVSEFAPPGQQKFLSYITGWIGTLTWQAGNASGGFLCGFMIQSLIVIKDPSYTMPAWQATVLVTPVMVVCLVVNIWYTNAIPSMQNFVMALHILGFLAIVIVLWVLGPHVSAYDALLNFEDIGGWSSMPLALMIGQISSVQALASSDAAAHMAEEVRDAGVTVPKAMAWTFTINATMGLIMTITYLFAMPSVDDAINDPTGFPMMYVFQQAMPVKGTIVMTVLMMVLLMAGNISYQASTARQAFAFARDNGLPFSSWIARVNPKVMVPANAVIMSTIITILLSLINIGSDTAFNAVISLGTGGMMGTYLISITCVLYRRIAAPHLLPQARWSLGRWGVLVNTISVAYAAFIFFFSFWPNTTPVDVESFNWAPVIFSITVIVAIIMYLVKGHKVYTGPVAYVEGHREHPLTV